MLALGRWRPWRRSEGRRWPRRAGGGEDRRRCCARRDLGPARGVLGQGEPPVLGGGGRGVCSGAAHGRGGCQR